MIRGDGKERHSFFRRPVGVAVFVVGGLAIAGGIFAAGAATQLRREKSLPVSQTQADTTAAVVSTPPNPPEKPEPTWVSADGVTYSVEPAVLAFLNGVEVSCSPYASNVTVLDFLKMRIAQGGSGIQQKYQISQGSIWESGTEIRVYEDIMIPGAPRPEHHNSYYYLVSETGVKRLDDPASAETNSMGPLEHPLGFMLTHRTAVCNGQWERERRAERSAPAPVEVPAQPAAADTQTLPGA